MLGNLHIGGLWASKSRPSPNLYLLNLNHTWLSVSTCSIGLGRCRDSTNFADIIVNAVINLDITISGVGGLDTGVEAVSTWYYAYVIEDSTGTNPVNGILSASPTTPTMPAGYNLFRRVGSIYNDSNGNFRHFQQFWSNTNKLYLWDIEDAYLFRVISSGFATVITNVSLAVFQPITSQTVYLANMWWSNTAPLEHCWFGIGNPNATDPPTISSFTNSQRMYDFFFMNTRNNLISYRVSVNTNRVFTVVCGYIDELK